MIAGPTPRPLPPGCKIDHSQMVQRLREKHLHHQARVLKNQETISMAQMAAHQRRDEQIAEKEGRLALCVMLLAWEIPPQCCYFLAQNDAMTIMG